MISSNSQRAAPYLHTISDAKSPGNRSVFTPASSHTFFVFCTQQEQQMLAHCIVGDCVTKLSGPKYFTESRGLISMRTAMLAGACNW